jgi:DNA polymerase IV
MFERVGAELLARELPVDGGIRLLGLTLSGIMGEDERPEQPALPL